MKRGQGPEEEEEVVGICGRTRAGNTNTDPPDLLAALMILKIRSTANNTRTNALGQRLF
jgi:hypothetical protein